MLSKLCMCHALWIQIDKKFKPIMLPKVNK